MAGEGIPFLLGGAGVVGLLVVFGGLLVLRKGVRTFRAQRAFARLEPTTTASIQPGALVKLVGTAGVDDRHGTVTGAFTGREALFVSHEVAEYRSQGDDSHDWEPIHEDGTGVPFRLVDGEGSVLVEPHPDCLDYDADRVETVVVERDEEPPERIREYVRRTEAVDAVKRGRKWGLVWGERRRYREAAISPGEDVVVYGRVVRDPDGEWGDSLVVVLDPTERGLVTDHSEASLSRARYGAVVAYLFFGLFMVVAPVLAAVGILASLGLL